MRKRLLPIFIIVMLIIGAGVLYGGMKYLQKPGVNEIPSVRIGATIIPVEVAGSDTEKQKGLSGRDFLEPGSGMLFVFSEPGNYSFWMPDMRFSIDIVWIADGKVVGIEKNVSNEFDPQNPRFYTPLQPVQYVLEVNAGFAEMNDIKTGDAVIFHNVTSSPNN